MSLLRVHAQGEGPALLWLHGFTQTRLSAWRFRSILADQLRLVTLDLPGHGASANLDGDLPDVADLVASTLDEPLALGGYSFGARVALHVVLRHPERVTRVVLLGATRGISDRAEREERRRRDAALAERIEEIGTDAFLDEWLAQPLFARLPPDARERRARSTDAAGLARALRHCGTGTQTWLGDQLGAVSIPLLALAGARDTKFAREAEAIARGVPHGTAALVDDAGHAAHLEHPELAASLVASFVRGG